MKITRDRPPQRGRERKADAKQRRGDDHRGTPTGTQCAHRPARPWSAIARFYPHDLPLKGRNGRISWRPKPTRRSRPRLRSRYDHNATPGRDREHEAPGLA